MDFISGTCTVWCQTQPDLALSPGRRGRRRAWYPLLPIIFVNYSTVHIYQLNPQTWLETCRGEPRPQAAPSFSMLMLHAAWKGPGLVSDTWWQSWTYLWYLKSREWRIAYKGLNLIARGQVKGQLCLDSSRSQQVSDKGATMANECGMILLGCREAFNDRLKHAMSEEQAVSFVTLF